MVTAVSYAEQDDTDSSTDTAMLGLLDAPWRGGADWLAAITRDSHRWTAQRLEHFFCTPSTSSQVNQRKTRALLAPLLSGVVDRLPRHLSTAYEHCITTLLRQQQSRRQPLPNAAEVDVATHTMVKWFKHYSGRQLPTASPQGKQEPDEPPHQQRSSTLATAEYIDSVASEFERRLASVLLEENEDAVPWQRSSERKESSTMTLLRGALRLRLAASDATSDRNAAATAAHGGALEQRVVDTFIMSGVTPQVAASVHFCTATWLQQDCCCCLTIPTASNTTQSSHRSSRWRPVGSPSHVQQQQHQKHNHSISIGIAPAVKDPNDVHRLLLNEGRLRAAHSDKPLDLVLDEELEAPAGRNTTDMYHRHAASLVVGASAKETATCRFSESGDVLISQGPAAQQSTGEVISLKPNEELVFIKGVLTTREKQAKKKRVTAPHPAKNQPNVVEASGSLPKPSPGALSSDTNEDQRHRSQDTPRTSSRQPDVSESTRQAHHVAKAPSDSNATAMRRRVSEVEVAEQCQMSGGQEASCLQVKTWATNTAITADRITHFFLARSDLEQKAPLLYRALMIPLETVSHGINHSHE